MGLKYFVFFSVASISKIETNSGKYACVYEAATVAKKFIEVKSKNG